MSRRILSRRRRLCGVCCDRERVPPGRLFFLLPTKERTKENCRCFDAADPRLRGCTPLRTPKWRSEVSAAKRTQYYYPFLTPPSLPPLLSREFPRTPAAFNGRIIPRASARKKAPLLGELAERARPEGSRRASRHHPFPGNHPPTWKGMGCRPPSPLSFAIHSRQSVGAGHARPAALLCCPSTG